MDALNISYIDDDPILRSIVKMTLQRDSNVVVREYPDGLSAIKADAAKPPDVILLDYIMPELNGLQVIGLLKSTPELSHVPVIFVTSNTKPEEIRKYMEAGAVGIIPKPFDLLKLSGQVSDFLTGGGAADD